MLLKIDLSKAFDKLSWDYIKNILATFGFSHTWIRWVMSLITSPFHSILVSGICSATFNPSRGIRKGDSLSPFIFIIMVEVLGHLFKISIQMGALLGLSLHNQPPASHQQFLDKNLIMGYPSVQEAHTLKFVL